MALVFLPPGAIAIVMKYYITALNTSTQVRSSSGSPECVHCHLHLPLPLEELHQQECSHYKHVRFHRA